ncbi:hypothetical protein F1737_04340 [Methanoplanus sp. FWC-SCC4]|uniref:Uncharacterized protein n=1 Tax=Methanochimaera problematica TaxID=2609417 RepID=A0AA97FBN7_9EURY|nr:hypothetical protein [Methanoplanus sp. FWC-SCC4]WOF15984.1 hypothetical protein F1737_04340 [Methanoplanus sp. FWC-SCC4]
MMTVLTKEVYDVLKKDRYYSEDLYIGIVELGKYAVSGMTKDEVKAELEPAITEIRSKPIRPRPGAWA